VLLSIEQLAEIRIFCENAAGSCEAMADLIDEKILRVLQADGRISNARLAEVVGLSPSACLRRLRLLEHSGVIRGYTALVDTEAPEHLTVFAVEIMLERQTVEFLSRFEAAVRKCPDILECYLMSGDYDYLVRVEARDPADYERIHRDQLSRLPGITRIRSSFAIRRVVGASSRAQPWPREKLEDYSAGEGASGGRKAVAAARGARRSKSDIA
jgi:DNA-binding Lrp family transcriptional regulator